MLYSRFDIDAVDVVRLLLPDVIVFIVSLVTLIIDILVVVKLRPGDALKDTGARGGSLTEEETGDTGTVEARHLDSERGTCRLCVCVCVCLMFVHI